MSIQFQCPSCRQPIEVDLEFAGKQAGCPYCSSVVNVPIETTYAPEPVPPARPTDAAPPPPSDAPPSLHVGDRFTPRERASRSFGKFALICTVVMILLVGAAAVSALVVGFEKLQGTSATQPAAGADSTTSDQPESAPAPPTRQEQAEQQTAAIEEAMKELASKPWFVVLNLGAELFGVIGLALAITSLVQCRRGNWRAIVSLIICGLFILCTCGAGILQLMLGGMPV